MPTTPASTAPVRDTAGEDTAEPDEAAGTGAVQDPATPEPAADGADGAEAEASAQSGQSADEPHRSGRRWRRRLLIAAVALVLCAALAGVGFLGWRQWQTSKINRAGAQAQQAAVDYAQILTSVDSNHVDENFRQVLDGATGDFKDMYSQSSTQLRQLLIDNKASAHGVVLESAVQSASPDQVVVLLFVDQSVSNAQVPDPRIDRSRIKMTMRYVDGRWRASKIELP